MASAYNNQIGQILSIDTNVINNIKKAEEALANLSKTSYYTAKGFQDDWGYGSSAEKAVAGFVDKINALKQVMDQLQSKDVKLKLEVEDGGLAGLRDLQNLQMGNLTINMPGLEDATQKIAALVEAMNQVGTVAKDFANAMAGVNGAVTQNITNVNTDAAAMQHLDDSLRRLSMQMSDANAKMENLLSAKAAKNTPAAVKSVEEISAALEKNGVTAAKLRTAYKQLHEVMMNSTIGSEEWNKASAKIREVKKEIDAYAEAIRKAEDIMGEMRQAMANMDMSGLGGMAKHDLEAMAQRMRSVRDSIRPDGATADLWKAIDQNLQAVEQEMKRVRDAGEKSRDQEQAWRNICQRVKDYHGELRRLRSALGEYMGLMGSNKAGTAVWEASAIMARKLAGEIAEIERRQKLATQSSEDFAKSLSGQTRKDTLKEMISDLLAMRDATAKGTAVWDDYNSRLKMAGDAYRREVIAEQDKIPAGQKAMAQAQGQYEASIRQTIQAHQAAKNAADAQYTNELNKLAQLQAALANVKAQHAQASSTMGASVADKWYGGDMARIQAEINASQAALNTLANTSLNAEITIEGLKKKVGEAFSPEVLSIFGDKLKTMSKTDLEGAVRYLESMRDSMGRGSDGKMTEEAKALGDFIRAAKGELASYKEMVAEVKAPKWSWEGDASAMAARASEIAAGTGAPAMLEELRELHKSLRVELEKTAGKGVAMSSTLRDAYHKAGTAVKEVEREIAGMPKPTGTARTFDDIRASAVGAHGTIRELLADYNDLLQKMRDSKTAVDWSMGSEWESNVAALTRMANEMNSFRNATVLQNQELQGLMDRMAAYQRDMQATGNASMGRYMNAGGATGGGIDELSKNIGAADASAAKLQQDLRDVQNILNHIPKLDVVTGEETEEWKRLVALEKQLKAELDKYKRDAGKPAPAPVDPNSLDGLIAKAKELKKELSATDAAKDAAKWAQLNSEYKTTKGRIDAIKKAMGDLRAQQGKLMQGFRNLRTVMVGAFSVGAITGYLKKAVEVHAEMRLQNTALAALLQNKDKADRMFMQIQQMAMQSPFSIKDLTTYTKQLAAYRVESEKLLGTTKMLADVSAGLGVGMDRLILAYGQVKSANYLRATEVRQFTEAGLNIAGELAKYFSELEGRMVSVGEVMDMITKRMVKFEDVEEVFKRVTAAGGLFYDMQKKQSETVYGMIQRITDAMTMMYDQIGQENSGLVKGALTGIRTMIQEWRAWAVYLKAAGIAFLAYKGYALAAAIAQSAFMKKVRTASTDISKFITGIKNFVISLKGMSAAQVQAALSSGTLATSLRSLGAVIATGLSTIGLTLLIGALLNKLHEWILASEEAKAAQAKLVEIEQESLKNADDMTARYKRLATIVTDLTKSELERQEALDEINRTYGDYLPLQDRTIEGIRAMAGEYGNATAAIKQHYAEVGRANKVQYLTGNFEKAVQNAVKDLDMSHSSVTDNEIYQWLYESVTSAIDDGFDPERTEEMVKRFASKMEKYTNGEWTVRQEDMYPLFKAFNGIAKAYAAVAAAKKDFVIGTGDGTLADKEKMQAEADLVAKQQEKWEKLQGKLTEISNSYTLLKKRMTDAQRAGKDYDWTEDAKKIQAMYKALNADASLGVKVAVPTAKQIAQKIAGSDYDIREEMQRVGYSAGETFVASFKKGLNTISDYVGGWIESMMRTVGLKSPSEMEQVVENVFEKVRNASRLPKNWFDTVMPDASSTPETMIEGLTKAHDALAASVTRYTNAVAQGMSEEDASIANLNGRTVEESKKLLAAYDKMRKAYGWAEKEATTGGGNHGRDKWNDRVELIKKMNTEYEKLLKYYTAEEAHQKIAKEYYEQFGEVFAGTEWDDISKVYGFTKAKSGNLLADMRNKYTALMSETSRKNAGETYAKYGAEIELKVKEGELEDLGKQVEEYFDNYELSKTLTELGVSTDLATIVGGTPTDLEQLKQNVEKAFKEMFANIDEESTGLEQARKDYEQYMKRIGELEQKNAEERLKNDVKYTIQGMSERGQIIAKAMQEQQKVMNSATMSDTAKSLAIDEIKKKMEEDIAKLDWEALKGGDLYVSMLENLESASTGSINKMIEKIESMQGAWGKALSPGQIKSIVNELDKMRDEVATRNPWSAVKKSLEEVNRLRREGKTLANLELAMMEKQTDKRGMEQELSDLETAYNLAKNYRDIASMNGQLDSLDESARARVLALIMQSWTKGKGWLADEIAAKKESLGLTDEQIQKLQGEMNVYAQNVKNIQKLQAEWKTMIGHVNGAYESIKNVLEASGADMDSVEGIYADAALSLVDMAGQIVLNTMLLEAMGEAANKAMGVIGWIAMGVQAAATLLLAMFKAHDKGLQNQIDNLKDKVDALKRAYDNLGESMERAYTLSKYQLDYNQSVRNLEMQISAYRQMIALEEKKKKKDKDALKEYREAIEDLQKELVSLKQQRIEDLGGIGADNFRDTASEFVDAWIDAFKETEDGLEGLQDNFEEFLEGVFAKQATMRIAGKMMEPLMTMIDSAVGGDGKVTADEIDKIREKAAEIFPELNEALKELWWSFDFKSGGDYLLSDLQKGITNITEAQAAALESITNSIRFGVYQQLGTMQELLAAVRQQYGEDKANPQLAELRSQTALLRSIDSRLASVIRQRGSDGKPAVKVG